MSGESLLQNLRAAKRRCNFAGGEAPLQYSRAAKRRCNFAGKRDIRAKYIFRETMPVFVP
ncbi:MAG: hypothetical protein DBX61_11725 [Clostridiales bacterium]|nr:MAG: hypothetical protein DBX61_11725 [Clostridiales bacterium]